MKSDLSFIILGLYSTSALAAAIPNPAAANEVAEIDSRGLGTFLTKLGAKLIQKGDDIKTGSKSWGDNFKERMQGGSKWPELKQWIKDNA